MSEPMTHFLAHARVAPIQMAFWGNPITSGSQQVPIISIKPTSYILKYL
jgi:hypothetical protein